MKLEPLKLGRGEISLLASALREDSVRNDVTTLSCVKPDVRVLGVILAGQPGVLAGMPVLAALFKLLDPRVKLRPRLKEGGWFLKGRVVADIQGPARAVLSGERTALNLLSRLSGIATLTRAFVKAAGRPCIYDTRKTTPLWRSFERYAVRAGGGRNHRFNLSSHVLVKDNHRSLGGGVWAAVNAARKRMGNGALIMAEVESALQTREALKAGADMLLFDNRSPAELKRLLRLVPRGVACEASGGLTLDNIRAYARTGVERCSVGALTHSAPPVDFSLELCLPKAGKG
jgi:nicotinate-nucleotide pyrophosphorylase (carboxylating)